MTQRDSEFTQRDSGESLQVHCVVRIESGLSQDSGFRQEDTGFGQEDSGFGQEDSGFSLKDPCLSEMDAGFA